MELPPEEYAARRGGLFVAVKLVHLASPDSIGSTWFGLPQAVFEPTKHALLAALAIEVPQQWRVDIV